MMNSKPKKGSLEYERDALLREEKILEILGSYEKMPSLREIIARFEEETGETWGYQCREVLKRKAHTIYGSWLASEAKLGRYRPEGFRSNLSYFYIEEHQKQAAIEELQRRAAEAQKQVEEVELKRDAEQRKKVEDMMKLSRLAKEAKKIAPEIQKLGFRMRVKSLLGKGQRKQPYVGKTAASEGTDLPQVGHEPEISYLYGAARHRISRKLLVDTGREPEIVVPKETTPGGQASAFKALARAYPNYLRYRDNSVYGPGDLDALANTMFVTATKMVGEKVYRMSDEGMREFERRKDMNMLKEMREKGTKRAIVGDM